MIKKLIFVRVGKGKKDRTTILSKNAVLVFKKYIDTYLLNYRFFEGVRRKRHSSINIEYILKQEVILLQK